MRIVWELLFGPARVFLEHPERAYLVAIGFLALLAASVLRAGGLRRGVQALLALTAVFWVGFGIHEQSLAGTGANIRVDFLFAWPPLAVVSLVAIACGIRDITAPSPLPEHVNNEPPGHTGATPDARKHL